MEKAIESLAKEVADSFCENDDNLDFMPNHRLDDFVTKSKVESVLDPAQFDPSGGVGSIDEAVCFVLRRAPRLFLILLLIEDECLTQHLKNCMDENFGDSSLPIQINNEGEGVTWQGPPDAPRYTWPKKLHRKTKQLFLDNQWSLTSPVFGTNERFRFQLAPLQRLPYLEVATGPEGNGFFGEVSRAVIHKNHIVGHKLPPIEWTSKISSTKTRPVKLPAYEIAIKRLKRGGQVPEIQWNQLVAKETENLNRARELKSPHLIKPIAAYEHQRDRCFIFRWADGGNLGDYWKRSEADARKKDMVLWLLEQFVGICSALQMLHDQNIRHGDLKPENILLFKYGHDIGSLQIADLGLTTFHEKEQHTDVRADMATKTPSGTLRYEPPEMDEKRGQDKPRSRQYDIWSMDCILLELLVWLVSGYSALQKFRKGTPEYFWQRGTEADGRPYEVDKHVVSVMEWLDDQLEADSAYKDMLKLVREKLLIVPVSIKYESIPGYREIAKKAHPALQYIYESSRDVDGYLKMPKLEFLSRIERQIKDIPQIGGRLAPPRHDDGPKKTNQLTPAPITAEESAFEQSEGQLHDVPQMIIRAATEQVNSNTSSNQMSRGSDHQEQSSKLNDDWTSIPDNDFAADFFDKIGWDKARPSSSGTNTTLCDHCHLSNFQSAFDGLCDVAALQVRARSCELCYLLQDALDRKGMKAPRTVELRQDAAHVGLKNGPNLLSLYCDPDPKLEISDGAQLGLPSLFGQASPEFFALLKEWIRVCDADHDTCHREEEDTQGKPTRLIEIGQRLRLVETADIHSYQYVALSHCWGPLKENEKFCTYKRNIEQLKKGIDFNTLPPTFRDAVTAARGLGMAYIWIDSLCIIQDDDDDWQRESGKMELVFSTAYCTIGASSARSSLDGFLHGRTPRTVVELPATSTGATYVCVDIDDFHTDVELSALNSRGWVLQERALSRRTIFFTSTQVYWECGAGIHCETLTHLENSKVALLGDANFPIAAVGHYRDGRQLLIQDLYERYSGLAFTKPADRSVAILGLQERLARTFKTKAAFGLFEEFFARGLLWKRRDLIYMKRIGQPPGRRIPSWSSLSKEGGIQHMDAITELKFKEIDWAFNDFKNPFSVSGGIESASFLGLARKIDLTKFQILVSVVFDEDEEFAVEDLRCVVIGRDKPGDGKVDLKYHVLIIHECRNATRNAVYERVGVASLRPEVVANEGSWVNIC